MRLKRAPLPPTEYQPDIPTFQSNFGVAYWRVEATEDGAKLFAPRWPPMRALIGPVLVSLVMTGGVTAAVILIWNQKGQHDGSNALVLGTLCWLIGMGGVWAAVLAGNRIEAGRGDVLRRRRDTVELPRSGTVLPLADVVRVEAARFVVWTRGSHESRWDHRDLVLVRRGPAGEELFERLVRDGAHILRVGDSLAEQLGVTLIRVDAGTFDSRTRARVDASVAAHRSTPIGTPAIQGTQKRSRMRSFGEFIGNLSRRH
jgi:hypothetical protein